MANEPERPIETLLHAAAKKRRDEAGAPFELHPADRRVLQGEVARRFAKPERVQFIRRNQQSGEPLGIVRGDGRNADL